MLIFCKLIRGTFACLIVSLECRLVMKAYQKRSFSMNLVVLYSIPQSLTHQLNHLLTSSVTYVLKQSYGQFVLVLHSFPTNISRRNNQIANGQVYCHQGNILITEPIYLGLQIFFQPYHFHYFYDLTYVGGFIRFIHFLTFPNFCCGCPHVKGFRQNLALSPPRGLF